MRDSPTLLKQYAAILWEGLEFGSSPGWQPGKRQGSYSYNFKKLNIVNNNVLRRES